MQSMFIKSPDLCYKFYILSCFGSYLIFLSLPRPCTLMTLKVKLETQKMTLEELERDVDKIYFDNLIYLSAVCADSFLVREAVAAMNKAESIFLTVSKSAYNSPSLES
jgi:hypothetical protein